MLKTELTELIPTIRRFAYSLTGSTHDADDLLQNTIERVLTKGVPDNVHLTKWVFRVCRNIWIDDFRSQKVRENATQAPELQEQQIIDGEQHIFENIRVEEVNSAMTQLPDEQRSVLALIAVEGMTYKEVAESLDIPTGTVMSRLARARSAMVRLLSLPTGGALV